MSPSVIIALASPLNWIYWALAAIYAATVLAIVGVVLSENRNPVKSLAWITVLLTIPGIGILLYIFFGRNIKNTRMISRRNKRRLRRNDSETAKSSDTSFLSPTERQQVEMGRALTGAQLHSGNDVTVFNDGTAKFNALLADIESAREYIHVQYYILSDDETGRRLAEALLRKAAEGVRVRVIYDHIGSFGTSNAFFRRLREGGVEIHPFFRVAFPLLATRINWRNHRKICVIDGKTGYIGGMNIADRYMHGGKFGKWRDTHLRITGPAVGALEYSFAVDWSFMGNPLVTEKVDTTPCGESAMQMLRSGPTSEWSNVEFMMIKAIGNARKRVYIQTPYFLPTEGILRALQTAALARVDVRVMIPAHSDSRVLTYASRSYVMECLRAGIKIYFYEAGMLHSKTMMIDDSFSAVGSANIDFRSFEHNFEATMFIYSPEINSRLCRQFIADQHECTRVFQPEWRVRPLRHKILESLTRLLSPIL